ncbi:treslin isoform X1 [Mobula hypostoma]|uniref:treslin isoform X1 n=1 Tax=Mobula hypostoma TaxID=723540 RepID=UPI002FC3BF6D
MVSHNLAFLVDTAASERDLSPALVRRAALRVLLHSACRAGFQDVRWAFKLFDSAAARGRVSRGHGHGFRELRLEHLQELEEALNRELGQSRRRGTAAATQTALIEALSDYPWDRPDITSPAKLGRGSAAEAPQPWPRNVLFLFAPCPLSRADLGRFLQLSVADSCHQLAEKIIPPPARALLSGHNIALHWVDTQPLQQFIGASDHVGYRLISEVMRLVGGSLIPFAALMELSLKDSYLPFEKTSLDSQLGQNGKYAKECVKQLKTVDALFPFDCTMNYFVSIDSFYRNTFPLQHGLVTITQGGQKICCPITLEPISCTQEYLTDSVNIIVKGVMRNWNPKRGDLSTHSWVLQQREQKETKDSSLLQRLLQKMAYSELHMVADIEMTNDRLPTCTGILSPLHRSTAIVTLIQAHSPEFEELLLQAGITEGSQEMSSELSHIVDKALKLISDSPEECLTSSDVTVPDWVHLELSETSHENISFVEAWFPLSELSGASSTLMKSFRSIEAMDNKEDVDSELALTGHLAEFYQRKAADEAGANIEHKDKRRRCGPRTPIRQKMKSMSRSLQMLNVARLNVKAQKSQTDGVQAPSGGLSTNQSKTHSGDKRKNKKARKDIADFKSNEEMVSSLKTTYQKCVLEEELSQFNFIKNTVAIVKMYLESGNAEDLEVTSINLIRTQLLKSSKSIRQHYGNQEDKEFKVRDCQLQVLLRLEMCQQFPSLQSDSEQLEQLVEEMTNLLRIISLTKDTTFLATFLEEEILNTYLHTLPKILGELYFGLGQNVPARLASLLPADFFSDESMSQDPESSGSSQPTSLAPTSSCADFEGEQLEELRTRSCRKRRNLLMARHRSLSEVSHNLRQIQLPKKSVKQENLLSHLSLAIEQPVQLQSSSQKEVQEVTKVRRNLFNHEMLSPRKKSKMPRSQSLSLDKGVKQLHNEENTTKSNRKLLTKKVTETPLHKQVSQRLLHKQIQGRCSESNFDVGIVEESPEKALSDSSCLRRSPRIRKASLAQGRSSSFYSCSRPMSRSLERIQSLSQKAKGADKEAIQSPNRFLFGAVLGHVSPKGKRIRSPEGLLARGLKSCPKLSSPDKTRAAQKTVPAHHYLTPRKKAKNVKSPSKRLNFAKNFLNKDSSPWKITTDSQFQSPRRSERLIKTTHEEGNSPSKTESESSFNLSPTVQPKLKLSSYKDHPPAKQSSRKKGCLASTCRISTADFGSQVKTPIKEASPLNSSVIESKKLSPSGLIDTLSKDKQSRLSTSGKLKLRKSKFDELLISRTPVKSFVSPQKLCLSESTKDGERVHDLSSPDKSDCLQSNPSTPSTPRNISEASLQTLLKTPVMTRSMCSPHIPSKFTESPGQTRVGFCATPSKSQLKTPSKSVTPPKSPVKTRSMFNRTPAKPQAKLPPKYSMSPNDKSPMRFNIESKPDVHNLFQAPAILDTAIKLVSEMEASTAPMKIPPKCATSVPRLNQVFETPEKQKRTIYNAEENSLKNKVSGKLKFSIYESEKQENISIPKATESCAASQTDSGSWSEIICDSLQNLKEDFYKPVGALDSISCPSQSTTSEHVPGVVLISEEPDLSPLASRIDSSSAGLQTEENGDISQGYHLPQEGSGLRLKFALQSKLSNSSVLNCVAPTESPLLQKESLSYEFRWTPDRRQRLAAAQQQQMLEVPRKISTLSTWDRPSMPTYEVELEMQDSGLPKLRFRRTSSSMGNGLKLKKCATECNNSPPSVSLKRSGCESPLSEAHTQWCVKHLGKTEAGQISPSLCFHASLSTPAKATPRKGGVQTYICQSYTPTQCSSSTSSPSQTDLGAVPWTPSPTHKPWPSQTPDAIKNWPRKKKAATTPLNQKNQKMGEPIIMQKDGNTSNEHYSNKTLPLEELGMEGVSRLQDQYPNMEQDQRFPDSPVTTFALRSRKRGSSFISPVETEGREVKKHKGTDFTGTSESGFTSVELQTKQSSSRSFAPIRKGRLHCSVEDDVFGNPAETSPSRRVKSGLSASGLLTLTQSPLLCAGRTPAKKRGDTRGTVQTDNSPCKKFADDMDQDYSPFAKMPVRRCITKTYSRKKLAISLEPP